MSPARSDLTVTMESGDLSQIGTLGTKHTDALTSFCSYFQTVVICSRGIKGRMCLDISKVTWSDFYSQEQLPILTEVHFQLKDEIDREGKIIFPQQSLINLFINVNP